jgi:hypothetical protein
LILGHQRLSPLAPKLPLRKSYSRGNVSKAGNEAAMPFEHGAAVKAEGPQNILRAFIVMVAEFTASRNLTFLFD